MSRQRTYWGSTLPLLPPPPSLPTVMMMVMMIKDEDKVGVSRVCSCYWKGMHVSVGLSLVLFSSISTEKCGKSSLNKWCTQTYSHVQVLLQEAEEDNLSKTEYLFASLSKRYIQEYYYCHKNRQIFISNYKYKYFWKQFFMDLYGDMPYYLPLICYLFLWSVNFRI